MPGAMASTGDPMINDKIAVPQEFTDFIGSWADAHPLSHTSWVTHFFFLFFEINHYHLLGKTFLVLQRELTAPSSSSTLQFKLLSLSVPKRSSNNFVHWPCSHVSVICTGLFTLENNFLNLCFPYTSLFYFIIYYFSCFSILHYIKYFLLLI